LFRGEGGCGEVPSQISSLTWSRKLGVEVGV